MNNSTPYLSVIIPAYNEEKRLPTTLRAVLTYLKNQDYSYEVVVVDDGSKDSTVSVAKELQKETPFLRVLSNQDNHGKGYVVRQGMLEARGEIRLFMDADNSTSLEHFQKMRPLFKQGFAVVIGTRDKRDHPEAKQAVPQPFWKRALGDIGNIVIQILLLPGLWDTQCGFKAFTSQASMKIFPLMTINRWAFDVEALALARYFGFKIGIIPVNWINNPESKVKLKGYILTFWEVLKIKLNFIKKAYAK